MHKHHHNRHKHRHQNRLPHERAKFRLHTRGIQAHKVAPHHLDKVVQQPAGDGGIEHHEQIVARDAEAAIPVPLGPFWFEHMERTGDALLAGTAHGELHDHNWQSHDEQKQQVDQYEGRAAVFSGDIGEPPHISQSDGTACGDQQEAQPGRKGFSLFQISAPFGIFHTNAYYSKF